MAVESPCNKVCQIEAASGYCRGCLRTIDEIMGWAMADDIWKRGVLDLLKTRSVRT
ncbi:MAG: DUF1289 domain-containing protein [Pseudomonadota bacterium]